MAYSVVWGLRLPRITAAIVAAQHLPCPAPLIRVFSRIRWFHRNFGRPQGACVSSHRHPAARHKCTNPAFAFLGGLLAVALTLLIPALLRNNSNLMLVLSGIIIGGALSSVLGFVKYIADPETELAAITYWQMGSFTYVTGKQLASVFLPMVLAALCLFGLAWRIDILSLGETEAQTLGTNVPLVRLLTVLCATLLTASSVCIAGTISWVGLVILILVACW